MISLINNQTDASLELCNLKNDAAECFDY